MDRVYGEESPDQVIGNETDYDRNWERYCSESKWYCPFDTIEADSRQNVASKGDDKYLSGYGDKVNSDKIPVSVQAFEDIEFIIETAVTL